MICVDTVGYPLRYNNIYETLILILPIIENVYDE